MWTPAEGSRSWIFRRLNALVKSSPLVLTCGRSVWMITQLFTGARKKGLMTMGNAYRKVQSESNTSLTLLESKTFFCCALHAEEIALWLHCLPLVTAWPLILPQQLNCSCGNQTTYAGQSAWPPAGRFQLTDCYDIEGGKRLERSSQSLTAKLAAGLTESWVFKAVVTREDDMGLQRRASEVGDGAHRLLSNTPLRVAHPTLTYVKITYILKHSSVWFGIWKQSHKNMQDRGIISNISLSASKNKNLPWLKGKARRISDLISYSSFILGNIVTLKTALIISASNRPNRR